MSVKTIEFECMRHRKPVKNRAFVVITSVEGGNSLVSMINFASPVFAISHAQLSDLVYSIDQEVQAVEDKNSDAEPGKDLSLPGIPMAGIPVAGSGKGLLAFSDKLRAKFDHIDQNLSPDERHLKNSAFDIIDKLLGRKKQ